MPRSSRAESYLQWDKSDSLLNMAPDKLLAGKEGRQSESEQERKWKEGMARKKVALIENPLKSQTSRIACNENKLSHIAYTPACTMRNIFKMVKST